MEERKKNLVTIRMDEHDKETLEYLSEHLDRSKTDTIIRACKFFSGAEYSVDESSGVSEKGRKSHYVHMRLTDSDKIFLDQKCHEENKSVSKFVRESIKAYYKSMKGF